MRDKLLKYAIVFSILLHLVLLCLVGRTSAAKPIQVDQLKVVQVDLVKTPDDIAVSRDKPDAPKPESQPEPSKVDVPYVPPINNMETDKHPPKPVPVRPPAPVPSNHARPIPGAPSRPATGITPGNAGGGLAGVTAPNGQDMGRVTPGNTPSGWVPGTDGGAGRGSGNGSGTGSREPAPNIPDGNGPGLVAPPPPPPPPPPRMVTETVCAISGMRPGPYCEQKDTRSFREGTEPTSICDRCKAPEPVHHSTLADRSMPLLVDDCVKDIKLPSIDDSGEYTVVLRYTVDEKGNVRDVEVAQSSGISGIDRAVAKAAVKMHYKPAVQNGEPRSVTIRRPFKIVI